ncbi:hypothetical protein SAMN05216302_10307 [Nitrosomonas aestuarii]|uniref:Uncharacterized protein n=1 Tax=Nitrosomonas aestuarii TaxID=52441 RepID=A0A1I4EUH1_9PROT|nr:hypothetical protein [Nitrosomonas aestuarii]SFL07791.1 hypothetical protein SAMN05216302_10307 [Nitrosomonas aestuarii]
MPLNNKRLIERARKAGKASGKARHNRTVLRNKGLVLAYRYFTDDSISKEDSIRAHTFLLSIKAGANLPEGVPLLVHLANAVNISKDRLQRILREAAKNA